MTESVRTQSDSRLRWYQRTGLWVVVAFTAAPVGFFLPGNYLSFDSRLLGLLAVVVLGVTPVGVWMGALVARRPTARVWLSLLAVVVLGLLTWAVWNGLNHAESEVFEACEFAEFDDGTIGQVDPELCATRDTFDAFRRNVWIVVAATWVAPLFIFYTLRGLFQPDDRVGGATARLVQVLGLVLLAVGVLSGVLAVAIWDELDSEEVLLAAVWVVVPIVLGMLMVRVGKRRREVPPSPHL